MLIKTKHAAHAIRTTLQPFLIDPQQHVKVWISRDGLPDKHQARFIKFRALNPNATLRLIYVDKYLTTDARSRLKNFAGQLKIILVDYDTLIPRPDELALKVCIDREIEYFFATLDPTLQGDLSRVADQLAWFDQIIRWGIRSDCDVEFDNPMPTRPFSAVLGIIARQKEEGTRISNDLTAGDPQHAVFVVARQLAQKFNDLYDAAIPDYFRKNHIDFDLQNYQQHPQYFEARNKQRKMFSLGGGPQLFAIALNYCGLATGYENRPGEIFELRQDQGLNFFSYDFLPIIDSQQQIKNDFSKLFPNVLGQIDSGWDTSWMPGQHNWKLLGIGERIRLTLFQNGIPPDKQLLNIEQIMAAVPKPKLSYLKNYLAHFFQALHLGKRHKAYAELPASTQQYIQKNEVPDETIRTYLKTRLGEKFACIAEKLKQDGVIVLPGYIPENQLKNLQAAYEREINKKLPHPLLQQVSFNLAADQNFDSQLLPTSLAIAHEAGIQALVLYHLGEQKLCAMRGYRQEPIAPVRLRAWDWHQDIKSQGPYGEIKIMILLNGVAMEGQAMRAMLGSHQFHWDATQLAGSKYTMDEALLYATQGVKICYGPPGSIVIFDTNIIHSGHRNLHNRRDVITMSYAPNKSDIADMFDIPDSAKLDHLNYTYSSGFWSSVPVDNSKLTEEQIAQLKKQYKKCPSLAEFKDRYSCDSSTTFDCFLIQIASQDMNSDLDLPLRLLTTMDKDRDNQMVEFRDASPNHPQFLRFKTRVQQTSFDLGYIIEINKLISCATIIGKFTEHPIGKIRSCAKFASDLAEAFSRIDSLQRLRSTMIYLHFTLDRVQHELKQNDSVQVNIFNEMANDVLEMYASTVFLDDLNEALNNTSSLAKYQH